MNETTTQTSSQTWRPIKRPIIIALAALVLLLAAAGYVAYRTWSNSPDGDSVLSADSSEESGLSSSAEVAAKSGSDGPATLPEVTRRISESELEAEYGLRLRLVAVTAADGLIDLRLKVVDADKAGQLLGASMPLPAIVVEDSGVVLQAPADPDLKLEDGIMVFGLYPNRQYAVDTGTAVSVQFGSISLGPVIAQ